MSARSIIQVESLSKRYFIGHRARHDTLVDTLRHGVTGLWTAWRRRNAEAREEFWALRDVSFAVAPGEVIGIVGRNGAGKSTLLKILSRITEPTTGRVALRGRVASLLEVGTGFHPELSGRDNIFLNGSILGMSHVEIRRKFDEIVAFAEVEKFIDTPVKRYSSGMYVRLAFAVAAHLEPEILIVDEVLAVGDAQFQQKCLGRMQSIAANHGKTILFVSHNLKALEHFCQRGLLFESGRIVMDGSAHSVVADYLRRGAARPGTGESKSLGEELDLVALTLTPAAVGSDQPVEFKLEFSVKMGCQIHDLHLFIYNAFGERAAIVDLRDPARPGGTRTVSAGQRLKYTGVIGQVPLVEGHYRVGFCVRTARKFQALYEVVDLHVSAKAASQNLMPYAPEYQGSTLLDYNFTVRSD